MMETNKQEIIKKAGVCPFCGSDEVSYLEMNWLEDGTIEQECWCDNCNCDFSEYYKTEYIDTEIKEEGKNDLAMFAEGWGVFSNNNTEEN